MLCHHRPIDRKDGTVKKLSLALVLLVLGLSLTVAGCGGDDEGSEGGTTTTETTASGGQGGVPSARGVWDLPQKTQSAAAAFWTKQRMKNAKPVEFTKPGSPTLDTGPVEQPDGKPVAIPPALPQDAKRQQIPKASELTEGPEKSARAAKIAKGYPFPYRRYAWQGALTALPARTWGKVFFELGGEEYVCSGTATNSGNKSVVWTAGHCVYDPEERVWANRKWIFVPGYDHGDAPYGYWIMRRVFTTRQWYDTGDFSYDFGAVVVEPVEGRRLVDTVGGQGITFNLARSQYYYSGGYPAGAPFDGEALFLCEAPFGNVDTSENPATTAIGCDMTGGSSGGGWLVKVDRSTGLGWLGSVNSYGYTKAQPEAMYGPYQGNVARNLFSTAARA
jgi:V8-like Glu-specific endopeptidase